jgi:phosphohistidine phosphatase
MKIIISRHGDAELFSPTGQDMDRPLSDLGKGEIRKMAGFIKKGSLHVQHIYHSPYLRTKQTAEIYADELGLKEVIETCDELAPGNECMDLLQKLRHYSNSDTFLLVSHNPGVSHFAARLIQDDALAASLLFATGTALALNIARERFSKAQIIWMLSPSDV